MRLITFIFLRLHSYATESQDRSNTFRFSVTHLFPMGNGNMLHAVSSKSSSNKNQVKS